MPNHVKNRIILLGNKKQLKGVIETFNTHHPAELHRAHDGTIICRKTEKKEDEGWSCAWFNEKTGEFLERIGSGEDIKHQGFQDGWEMAINPAYDAFPDFYKVIPQPDNIFNGSLGEKEKEMCRKEGRPNWYDWNIDNWGTKWDGYNFKKEDDNTFTFETAWSSVPRIIEKMSRQFPNVTFVYEWADEDTGYNCGQVEYINGNPRMEIRPEGGSKTAYDIAFKLRPKYREYYKLIDGEYKSKEEDE